MKVSYETIIKRIAAVCVICAIFAVISVCNLSNVVLATATDEEERAILDASKLTQSVSIEECEAISSAISELEATAEHQNVDKLDLECEEGSIETEEITTNNEVVSEEVLTTATPVPTPTPTPTPTATPAATHTPMPTPIATPVSTHTPKPIATPIAPSIVEESLETEQLIVESDVEVEAKEEEEIVTNESTAVSESTPTVESTPEITFETVNNWRYVSISELNVRSGPSTDFDVINTLPINTKINVIGIGSNEWYKISINGGDGYLYGPYTSQNKVHIETLAEKRAKRGAYGSVSIPSFGIDIALFNVSAYDGAANQRIVDANDSAAIMYDYGAYTIIADHQHQNGFNGIWGAVPNSTIAYVTVGSNTTTYICVDRINGYNRGELVDMNGNSIRTFYSDGLIMYTCNLDNTITITRWQPC